MKEEPYFILHTPRTGTYRFDIELIGIALRFDQFDLHKPTLFQTFKFSLFATYLESFVEDLQAEWTFEEFDIFERLHKAKREAKMSKSFGMNTWAQLTVSNSNSADPVSPTSSSSAGSASAAAFSSFGASLSASSSAWFEQEGKSI